MTMRILICEDHAMCREGMAMAFRQAVPDALIEKVATLGDADRIIDEGHTFDFVLTDLMLPDSDGFATLLHFIQRLPDARVAVATSIRDPEAIARARAFGAVGFLAKGASMSELLLAIRKLLAGEQVFPEIAVETPDDPAVRLLDLTPSQMRMVVAAASGQLNKQIAHENGLSEATVKAHLAAAFKKLKVNNRTQAGLLVQSLSLPEMPQTL